MHAPSLVPQSQSGCDLWRWALGCSLARDSRLQLTTRIDDVDPAWDSLVSGRGLYLQRPFLAALEEAADEEAFHYALFRRAGRPLGVARFERARFIGPSISPMLPDSAAVRLAARAVGLGDSAVETSALLCGSSFTSNQSGFAFASDVRPEDAVDMLGDAARAALRQRSTSAVVVVDPTSQLVPTAVDGRGYAELKGGDRMVLELSPAWRTMDDYLGALRSKFRSKARRAHSKSARLEIRPLELWDLWRHETRLQELLDQVCGRAAYRLGCIRVGALTRLRAALGDEMQVLGYFLDGELVGFLSAFQVGDTLDAHVVGIDYAHNRAHGIYPRMLLDYVQLAIDRGLSRIDFGRTAEEIKSTLGARPVPTPVFLRHRSALFNPVVGLIADAMEPQPPVLRQPFKLAARGLAAR